MKEVMKKTCICFQIMKIILSVTFIERRNKKLTNNVSMSAYGPKCCFKNENKMLHRYQKLKDAEQELKGIRNNIVNKLIFRHRNGDFLWLIQSFMVFYLIMINLSGLIMKL